MLVGYARVSTSDQNLDLQVDNLKASGCEKVFPEKIGSRKVDRPQLMAALEFLRDGDTLVVWKLDRLGRSIKDLIQIVELLQSRGIAFKSLTEGIDTTTAGGRLIFHIFGALAEFERDLIRERTNAGIAAAKARGREGGRRFEFTKQRIADIDTLVELNQDSVAEICRVHGISRSTYYRRRERLKIAGEIK